MTYMLVKKGPDGKVYQAREDNLEEVAKHIEAMAKYTKDHQLLAVISIP